MPLPILQPSTNLETQIRGDVIIDDSAIIADGVILNASQGSKIVIRAGACLGMGTIINAYEGDVEIKESVILGSGTLIVGGCIIGSQASLGASVTVYNANVEPRTVISAGTVIGDRSRKLDFSKLEDNKSEDNKSEDNEATNEVNGVNEVKKVKEVKEVKNTEEIHEFVNPYSQYKISSPPLYRHEEKKEISEEDQNQVEVPNIAGRKPEVKQPNKINSPTDTNFQNPPKPPTTLNNSTVTGVKEVVDEEANNDINDEVKLGNSNDEENSNGVVENDPWQEKNVPKKQDSVVGKVYINRLLYTLFPHKN